MTPYKFCWICSSAILVFAVLAVLGFKLSRTVCRIRRLTLWLNIASRENRKNHSRQQ
jgi:hypothetical protein